MVASQVHLVRHGEVFNPDGVLYGRRSGFGLSELGKRMAQAAADDLVARHRSVAALFASPLQRTRESAQPIAAAFEIPTAIDDRLIEPTNHFEGMVMRVALRSPANWPFMVNPMRPSWGEAYRSIADRMRAAIADAFNAVDTGDVVLVSHQLPIWVAHLSLERRPFMHDPRRRRCALSSITTLSLIPDPRSERTGQKIVVETGYTDPAAALAAEATDVGAV
ncbi:MAG: histidine phosphatase family protein [Microbacteriaceae bacterium]